MSKQSIQKRKLMHRAAEALASESLQTMGAIAKAADISRATLYRHFPNRDALIREIALASLAETDSAVEGIYDGLSSYREAFRRTMEAIVPLGARFNFLARERCLSEEVKIGMERQAQQLLDMVKAAQEAGEIDPSMPARWVSRHFDAISWLAWAEVSEGHVASKTVADLAFRTFWSGVQIPPSPQASTTTNLSIKGTL